MQADSRMKQIMANEKDPSAPLGMTIREHRFSHVSFHPAEGANLRPFLGKEGENRALASPLRILCGASVFYTPQPAPLSLKPSKPLSPAIKERHALRASQPSLHPQIKRPDSCQVFLFALFIMQCIDRIQLRRLLCRIEAENKADQDREDEGTDNGPRCDDGRDL